MNPFLFAFLSFYLKKVSFLKYTAYWRPCFSHSNHIARHYSFFVMNRNKIETCKF